MIIAKYRQKGQKTPITAKIKAVKARDGLYLQLQRRVLFPGKEQKSLYKTEIAKCHDGTFTDDGCLVFMGVHTNTLFYVPPIFCRRLGLVV